MRKILFQFILTLTVILFASCSSIDASIGAETAGETAEPSTTLSIVENGTSRFEIVYDTSREAKDFATELATHLKLKFSASLKCTDGSDGDGRYRIVVGEVGDGGKNAVDALSDPFDFSVSVKEDTLFLSARNQVSYHYLLTYLKKEVLTRKDGNNLSLTPEDDFRYSKSDLAQTDYIAYLKSFGSTPALEDFFVPAVFEHGTTELLYRIYVPFKADADKKYPVFVNLHGAGIRGSDNKRPLAFVKDFFKMKELSPEECIVIVPQCPKDERWVDANWNEGSYELSKVPESNELAAVAALVESVLEEFPADRNRVYAAGFSMGGYGTWNLLMNHPDLFAAGVPMCGAASPTSAKLLLDMPVWTVHGDKDPTVPVEGSREIVEAIRNAGGTLVKYTELPGVEHDVWNYTYTNKEIFTWLFSQKKG